MGMISANGGRYGGHSLRCSLVDYVLTVLSKMFDETADGYGRGESTAVVCLKCLYAAVRDGDPVERIPRETEENQDGRTKGTTIPSAGAQAKLIQQTYARAGLDPTFLSSRSSFFEAHGKDSLISSQQPLTFLRYRHTSR
jgi:hypothetical protein